MKYKEKKGWNLEKKKFKENIRDTENFLKRVCNSILKRTKQNTENVSKLTKMMKQQIQVL